MGSYEGNSRNKIKDEVTPVHVHLFTRLSNINVTKLSKDDPLCIGIIDLSSDKYIISENNFKSLIGKKADIKNLGKDVTVKNVCYDFIPKRNEVQKLKKFVLSSRETVTHDQWVEADHVSGHIASGITDVLLQEIKLNALQRVSENTFVEIISHLLI
ncbi:8847_t:CDS:2 [Cetraspora pellucida]|uniref:8847_t:CDS:1 n=1 Tax=Cetraspora pellucida TaxID=1433469 RepID=A0A9N9GEZ0_9GLOM|nr:8847_t:CDS:2 [Cetraspora pellucida]